MPVFFDLKKEGMQNHQPFSGLPFKGLEATTTT
jgi:hypothetical protein